LSKNIVYLFSLYVGYDVNKKTAKPSFDTIDTAVAINWAFDTTDRPAAVAINWAHLKCLNALALLS